VAFPGAQPETAQMLEDIAVKHAREGLKKGVLYKGKSGYRESLPLYETELDHRLPNVVVEGEQSTEFCEQTRISVEWSSRLEELNEQQVETLIRQLEDQKALAKVTRELWAAGHPTITHRWQVHAGRR
jgi:hypothetical protein